MPSEAVLGIIVGKRGRGSNMEAIIDACLSNELPARVGVVIAPAAEIPAVEKASERGVPIKVVDPSISTCYGAELVQALQDSGCNLVCLAGYTRLLPSEVLDTYPHSVLNIHPALLPRFGGKGMYGIRVHEAVLEAGEAESGCTVHYVTEQYDEGAIILQRRCDVYKQDTPDILAQRVLEQEHLAYPEAIRKVLNERAN